MLPISLRMSPVHLLLVAFAPLAAALLCLGAHAVARTFVPQPAGPVYSLNTLWAHLQRDPARWLGRTVRVHAVAEPCALPLADSTPPCADPRPALFDAGPHPHGALLLLPGGATPATLGWLRGLPIMGTLIPPPPEPRWGVSRDYMLQIRLTPCPVVGISSCYDYAALLL